MAQNPARPLKKPRVRALVAFALAIAACAVFAAPAPAVELTAGQSIIVRYYSGETLVKTLTVLPDGEAKWAVQNVALVGKIDRADVTMSAGGAESTFTAPVTDAFRIGPGDVLDVNVWDNQQISRTVPVRPDGMISLPLVGDRRASGHTTAELKAALESDLKRFIETPTVTVTVTEINSYKIFVQGAVQGPGAYPVTGVSTITHAISLAGGFTEFADKSAIVILRRKDGGNETIKVNYNRILSGKDKDARVLPGDTIVVP
jgi:polysaccharide export outer membrane protein